MDNNQQKTDLRKKYYFICFIIFSLAVIIIFGVIIANSFIDYASQLKTIENYFRSNFQNAIKYTPKVNKFDPIKGEAESQITIFEYSDFICPACQSLQSDLQSLEKLYGNKISLVFKGLPISLNPENRASLNAAYCAWEQNYFWQYQLLLYQNRNALNTSFYNSLAKELNLDTDQFSKCLDNNKYANVIEQNLADALNMQISSIPTIFVNEIKVEGLVNYNSIKKVIDAKLNE